MVSQLAIDVTIPFNTAFQFDELCKDLLKGASKILCNPSGFEVKQRTHANSIFSGLPNQIRFLPVEVSQDGKLQTCVREPSPEDLLRMYALKVGRYVAPHSTILDQEILGEVAMQSHEVLSVIHKLKKIRAVLDLNESEIAAILRCSRQSLHNWNNPVTDGAINPSKNRALNAFFQVALMWEKLTFEFCFSDYSLSRVSGNVLGDILPQESLSLEAILGHLRGMEQLHVRHLDAVARENNLVASGFSMSDSLSL